MPSYTKREVRDGGHDQVVKEEAQPLGNHKGDDFVESAVYVATFKHMENIGCNSLTEKTKPFLNLSHNSLTNNTHKVIDCLYSGEFNRYQVEPRETRKTQHLN